MAYKKLTRKITSPVSRVVGTGVGKQLTRAGGFLSGTSMLGGGQDRLTGKMAGAKRVRKTRRKFVRGVQQDFPGANLVHTGAAPRGMKRSKKKMRAIKRSFKPLYARPDVGATLPVELLRLGSPTPMFTNAAGQATRPVQLSKKKKKKRLRKSVGGIFGG